MMLGLSRQVCSRLAGAAGAQASRVPARAIASSQPVRGLDELFDNSGRKPEEYPDVGRAWLASDLRKKSFDDLHKLWYVMLKERHLLAAEREMFKIKGLQMPAPTRITKVRKGMARIKAVLAERALAEGDFEKQSAMKYIIDKM